MHQDDHGERRGEISVWIQEIYWKIYQSPEPPLAPGTNLRNSKTEKRMEINQYMSFVGKIMWYNTKVGPEMENKARKLSVQMSHPGI